MQRKQQSNTVKDDMMNRWSWNNEDTQPDLWRTTVPVPALRLSSETRWMRFKRGLHTFFAAIVHKINQLLRLAFVVLLLLLLTRFTLIAFGLSGSLFAQWVFLLTAPPMLPFTNLAPTFLYQGYHIDANIFVALLVYAVVFKLIARILRILVS